MQLSELTASVTDDAACGPDLDMVGDMDYMNFAARIETMLPESFFSFDRTTVDFKAEHQLIDGFLDRSRDLRLLVFKAKLALLDRKVDLFCETVSGIVALLRERWDDVHPQPLDGDAGFRGAMLAALDDMPHVILPLQTMPLFNTRRAGWLSYRHGLLVNGKIEPREAEADIDLAMIGQAIRDVETSDRETVHGQLKALLDDVKAVNTAFAEKAGGVNWLRLQRLPEMIGDMLAFVAPEGSVAPEIPNGEDLASGVASSGEASAVAVPQGAIRSTGDVAAALSCVSAYFTTKEPSSAALLLVRQCQDLIGKSFYDVVRQLMPENAEQVKIKIGRETGFALPLHMLANTSSETSFEETDDNTSAESTATPDDEEASNDSGGDDATHDDSTGEDENRATAPASKLDLRQRANGLAHSAPRFHVQTRQDAVALLAAISSHLRTADPANPIPLLLDHARGLVGREFIDLMRQMLPTRSLDLTESDS
jgi:type VI secretion system protein ImpA